MNRCLEKLPQQRYQAMSQVLEDLRRVTDGARDDMATVSASAPGFIRRLVIVGVLLVTAGAAALTASKLLARHGAAAAQIHSIAVLPFQNLSGDPNQEYVSDGMTDALISSLAQIHALDVISRTSSMRFKGTRQSIPEIGRALGVDALVESSGQKSGNHVRIIARLIRASSDTHVWSQEFNGSTADLLALESDVTRAIADAVHTHVTPDEYNRLATPHNIAPDAQDAFLLGRYQYWRTDAEGYRQAIESFRRAITIQPDFAAAYAGLSIALRDLEHAGGGATLAAESRTAAIKALELDPMLAEAHAAVGAVSADGWEWGRAEQEYRKATDLNPNSQDTCHCYFALLSILGRHPEAIEMMQRSARVNPLVSASFANLGMRLYDGRRYHDAEVALQRAVDMEPNNRIAGTFLALTRIAAGRPGDAVRGLDIPLFRGGSLQAFAVAAAGDRRRAFELLRRIRPRPYSSDALYFATAFASLGQMDDAFGWLTRAFDERFAYVPFANVSPLFDLFRAIPGSMRSSLACICRPEAYSSQLTELRLSRSLPVSHRHPEALVRRLLNRDAGRERSPADASMRLCSRAAPK